MVFLDLPDTECIQLFVEIMVHKFSQFQRGLFPPRISTGAELIWLRTRFNSVCPVNPSFLRSVPLGRM